MCTELRAAKTPTSMHSCLLLAGFSYYPTVLENSTTAILDGLVISPATLPGGALAGYNLGYTVVHETGHWLLLSHTFQVGSRAAGSTVSHATADACVGCSILLFRLEPGPRTRS